jgi:hypothetical protein
MDVTVLYMQGAMSKRDDGSEMYEAGTEGLSS